MSVWIGTSGYNYPEWKGSFYPETMPAAKMLPYYAERFPTVEINYTFYRTPNEKILDGWNRATPDRYKLTLKAPKRITHDRRLRDCADPVRQFFETAATLGPKLGALRRMREVSSILVVDRNWNAHVIQKSKCKMQTLHLLPLLSA